MRLQRSAVPGLLLRVAIAGALLFVVFRVALPPEGRTLDALGDAWTTGVAEALGWLGVAWALLGASFAIGALRFRTLLRGAGLDAGFGTLLRAYVVASFFNIVLPGAILGDAYRVWDARRDTGRGSEVLGLVVLERLLSLAALGGIALVALPALPLDEDAELGGLLAAICLGLVAVTGAALHPRANDGLRRLASPLTKLSRRLGDAVDGALSAVASLREAPRALFVALALSLAMQALPVAAALALAVPLDAAVAWYWYVLIVPFVTLVASIPISIGGAGVRESLYVALFGAVGMRPEVALALSLSALAASLVWGGVGLLVFSLGRRSRAPGPEPA